MTAQFACRQRFGTGLEHDFPHARHLFGLVDRQADQCGRCEGHRVADQLHPFRRENIIGNLYFSGMAENLCNFGFPARRCGVGAPNSEP